MGKFSEEKVFEIIKMLEKGKTQQKIAYATKASISTVARIGQVIKYYQANDWDRLKRYKKTQYQLSGNIMMAIEHYYGIQPPKDPERPVTELPVANDYDITDYLERIDSEIKELMKLIKHIGILLENSTKAQYELLKVWRGE